MTTIDRLESTTATTRSGVATELARALVPFVGGDLPVRLPARDGSEAALEPVWTASWS